MSYLLFKDFLPCFHCKTNKKCEVFFLEFAFRSPRIERYSLQKLNRPSMHGRLGLVTSKDMTSHFIGRREPIIFLHRNSYLTAMKSMENCFTKLKESEKKTKSHEATKITAKDRVKQYSAGTFHEESGLLFCTVCKCLSTLENRFLTGTLKLLHTKNVLICPVQVVENKRL